MQAIQSSSQPSPPPVLSASLQKAIEEGDLKTIRFLLKDGAAPLRGFPLHAAVRSLRFAGDKEKLEAVKLLIQAGADLDAKDSHHLTALDHAIHLQNIPVAEAILSEKIGVASAKIQSHRLSESLAEVKERLHITVDLNALDPFQRAAYEGNIDALQKAKVSINQLDRHGLAPIHYAVLGSQVAAFETLLKLGADPQVLTRGKDTIVHLAAIKKSAPLLQKALECKVDVNWQNSKGETALHYAFMQEHWDGMKMLVQKGANLSIPNVQGVTPPEALVSLAMLRDPLLISAKDLGAALFGTLFLWQVQSAGALNLSHFTAWPTALKATFLGFFAVHAIPSIKTELPSLAKECIPGLGLGWSANRTYHSLSSSFQKIKKGWEYLGYRNRDALQSMAVGSVAALASVVLFGAQTAVHASLVQTQKNDTQPVRNEELPSPEVPQTEVVDPPPIPETVSLEGGGSESFVAVDTPASQSPSELPNKILDLHEEWCSIFTNATLPFVNISKPEFARADPSLIPGKREEVTELPNRIFDLSNGWCPLLTNVSLSSRIRPILPLRGGLQNLNPPVNDNHSFELLRGLNREILLPDASLFPNNETMFFSPRIFPASRKWEVNQSNQSIYSLISNLGENYKYWREYCSLTIESMKKHYLVSSAFFMFGIYRTFNSIRSTILKVKYASEVVVDFIVTRFMPKKTRFQHESKQRKLPPQEGSQVVPLRKNKPSAEDSKPTQSPTHFLGGLFPGGSEGLPIPFMGNKAQLPQRPKVLSSMLVTGEEMHVNRRPVLQKKKQVVASPLTPHVDLSSDDKMEAQSEESNQSQEPPKPADRVSRGQKRKMRSFAASVSSGAQIEETLSPRAFLDWADQQPPVPQNNLPRLNENGFFGPVLG